MSILRNTNVVLSNIWNAYVTPFYREIVTDHSEKTGKDCGISRTISRELFEIANFIRFLEDFIQIHMVLTCFKLSFACTLLQSFLCEPGFILYKSGYERVHVVNRLEEEIA